MALAEASRRFSATLRREAVLEELVRAAAHVLGEAWSLFVIEPDGVSLRVVARIGPDDQGVPGRHDAPPGRRAAGGARRGQRPAAPRARPRRAARRSPLAPRPHPLGEALGADHPCRDQRHRAGGAGRVHPPRQPAVLGAGPAPGRGDRRPGIHRAGERPALRGADARLPGAQDRPGPAGAHREAARARRDGLGGGPRLQQRARRHPGPRPAPARAASRTPSSRQWLAGHRARGAWTAPRPCAGSRSSPASGATSRRWPWTSNQVVQRGPREHGVRVAATKPRAARRRDPGGDRRWRAGCRRWRAIRPSCARSSPT